MIYFTSDLHLGHANIIRFCNRPFSDVDEMDETIIANWKSRVTDRDDVYILGDLMYRAKADPDDVLSRLPGRKHLVVGNHDHTWLSRVDIDKHFVEVKDIIVLKTGGITMTLCHYPMLSWPHSFYGSYMVYGHIHNSVQEEDDWEYIREQERMLNAGVDVNGFYPVTFEEMVRNNETFKWEQWEKEEAH